MSNLLVNHITLDAEKPCHHTYIREREALVYALIGRIRVYANHHFLGVIGGRRSVTEPLAHVIRFPAGVEWQVSLVMDGFSADCLLASCEALPNACTKLPYMHWNDAYSHTVGEGTHQRTVTEVVTPPSFRISAGETYNPPGTTSSWPPHASQQDLLLYQEGKTTWEEWFYVIAPQPAQATLIGLYPGGKQVSETRVLTNGELVQMPLGSHAVTAAANSFAWYCWLYAGNALQKSYNKFSHHTGAYLR